MALDKASQTPNSILAEIEADPVLLMRRNKLKDLAAARGGPNALARELGYEAAAFIVQMIGPNPTRKVTDKSARAYEKKLHLPEGTLDGRAAAPTPAGEVNPDLVVEVAALVHKVCGDLRVQLVPSKFSNVVKIAYRDAVASGTVREDVITQLVQLAN